MLPGLYRSPVITAIFLFMCRGLLGEEIQGGEFAVVDSGGGVGLCGFDFVFEVAQGNRLAISGDSGVSLGVDDKAHLG
jgi:hypothetical protein